MLLSRYFSLIFIQKRVAIIRVKYLLIVVFIGEDSIVISNASAKLRELTNCILLFYIKVSEEEIKDIYQLYENTWEDLLQFHWVRRLNYFPRVSKV